MKYFIVVFNLILLFIIIKLQNHTNKLLINSKLLDKKFEIDYKTYKACINKTNMINCGRNKSIFKKHNKPSPIFRKQFILPKTECKVYSHTIKECNSKKLFILVGVGTGPEYFYERHVYRIYYQKFKYLNYYFFMGLPKNDSIYKKVYEENEIYKDIIIFPFISSYYNLTSQIICTFKWVNTNCHKYKWYIHQTSDSYLNVRKIFSFLKYYNECKCIIGYIHNNTAVIRNRNSEFYIPYHVFNSSLYPPYPNGPGYFVHKNAIREICENFNIATPKLWIDDVFIGIVIFNTNISLINLNSYFHMFGKIYYRDINKYFLIHNLSPSEIYLLEMKSINYNKK